MCGWTSVVRTQAGRVEGDSEAYLTRPLEDGDAARTGCRSAGDLWLSESLGRPDSPSRAIPPSDPGDQTQSDFTGASISVQSCAKVVDSLAGEDATVN